MLLNTVYSGFIFRFAATSQCVDMDCDGKKICFIVDKDGSFLGTPGTIIPNASYEWNGDTVHGLGDYRIPSVQMTNMDGSKKDTSDVYDVYGMCKVIICACVCICVCVCVCVC